MAEQVFLQPFTQSSAQVASHVFLHVPTQFPLQVFDCCALPLQALPQVVVHVDWHVLLHDVAQVFLQTPVQEPSVQVVFCSIRAVPTQSLEQEPAQASSHSPLQSLQPPHDVIDAMKVGPAIVLGHSWAGALALALALDHPARVSGLVLAAPVAMPTKSASRRFSTGDALPTEARAV